MPDDITSAVARWVASLGRADIPPSVVARARLQTVSVLAAILAGARRPQLAAARDAARGWGSGDDATVFPAEPRAPLQTACYLNAAASVSLDYDDYLFAGHTGHSSVVASLAYAEMLDASGEDYVVAQVAANEVAGRLGAAMLLGPHNGQMWTQIHALAGACIGARFLKLDEERTGHAIGIALAQPPWPLAPAFFGPDSKMFFAAEPLCSGIRAATLATGGLTGARDIIGGAGGLLEKIASRALPSMFGGLGSAWVTESLAFKVVPGCAYVDTPVEAMQRVMTAFADKHGRALAADDVESLRVDATLFTDGMERMSAPHRTGALRAADVNFSAALSLGVLVACGELNARALDDDSLSANRDAIEAVASRTSVAATEEMNARIGGLAEIGIDPIRLFDPAYEPSLDGADFGRYRTSFPARVTLLTAAGEEYAAEVDEPTGAPGRPFEETEAAVRAKFLTEARGAGLDPAEALARASALDAGGGLRARVAGLFR